jgi:hypothetical protein
MAFEKNDPNINRGGRPKSARNKVSAQRDITNALAKGKSLEDMVVWLSDKIDDLKVSDPQKAKFMTELIKLKLELTKIELKIVENTNPIPKPKQDTDKPKSSGEVIQAKAVFNRFAHIK